MNHIAKQLKDNWMILSFFVGVILWYGNINNRIASAEGNIAQLQGGYSEIQKMSTNIYLLCQALENAKCIKPDSLIK